MKTFTTLAIAIAIALPAVAGAKPADDTVVNIAAQKGEYQFRMNASEYTDFKREYTLSNGSVLRLSGTHRNMTAQIDEQPVHRIVATSRDSFQAVGHHLSAQLNLTDPMAVSGYVEYVDESRKVADISEPMVVRVAFR